MISLFEKDIDLNRLAYISFTLSGMVNYQGSIWFTIYSSYQLVNNIIRVSLAIVFVIIGNQEIKDIVAALSTAAAGSLASLKLVRMNLKRKMVRSIFDRLEAMRLKLVENEQSLPLVTKLESFGRKLSVRLTMFDFIGFPLVSFIFATIKDLTTEFKPNPSLVVKVWIPWNRDSVWIHIVTNFWLTLITSSCLMLYTSFFIVEIAFSLYVSAYISSMQNDLMNTGIGNGEILVQYKDLIQLINDYNELMSGQMYIETLIAPIIPCGYGLASIRALLNRDYSTTFQSIVRTFLALLPCTVSCYFSQIVLTQMERLHEATYMSNWYEENPKIRKDLLILMTRTTKPKSINYRLFVTFDHVLFSVVLQVIYSYFMLMVNMEQQ